MKKKKQQPNPRKKKKSRNNKEKSTITQKSELIKHKKDPNWNRNYKLILSTLSCFDFFSWAWKKSWNFVDIQTPFVLTVFFSQKLSISHVNLWQF